MYQKTEINLSGCALSFNTELPIPVWFCILPVLCSVTQHYKETCLLPHPKLTMHFKLTYTEIITFNLKMQIPYKGSYLVFKVYSRYLDKLQLWTDGFWRVPCEDC